MRTNSLPNDLLQNFNPISTVIAIPIYNWVLYPGLRKRGINFSLIQRMSCGYFIGAILNAAAAIIQWQIYETSPCGYHATNCGEVSPLVCSTSFVDALTSICVLNYDTNKITNSLPG